MAVLQSGVDTTLAYVDPENKALRVAQWFPGEGYSTSGTTGAMAAALAANSAVFAMRLDPGAAVNAYVTRMRIEFACSTAFTAPTTAGRRLSLFRGSGAATTGGTAIATAGRKRADNSASEFDAAGGGDIRIATTAALGVAGITFEAGELATVSVAAQGTANASVQYSLDLSAGDGGPITLRPGELLAIRNPAAMDAAGVWNITVTAHWYEISTTLSPA